MSPIQKIVCGLAIAIGLLIVIRGALPPRYDSDFNVRGFAELPVQTGGRIMPLDSVAINSLRVISGRSQVRLDDGAPLSAIAWFLEASLNSENADAIPVFRIDSAEILGLFGWAQEDRMYFSFNELRPHFATISREASHVNPEAQLRSAYERQLVQLSNSLTLYHRLVHSLVSSDSSSIPTLEYQTWESAIVTAIASVRQSETGAPINEEAIARFSAFLETYQRLAALSEIGIVPPVDIEDPMTAKWSNLGESLLESPRTGTVSPVVFAYGKLAEAWRSNQPDVFNETIEDLHQLLDQCIPLFKVQFEEFFNTFSPFYQATILYVWVFILAAIGWLVWSKPLHTAAFWLMILALIVHTFGLFARMYIQGRPPVTNLYSSAIFVGWGAVVLGIVLERLQRNGLGSAVAGLCGFSTLIIAYNLARTGDTLEMMRAVLDSNFWLATHVIIITIGYSAVFVAGVIGMLYIVLGRFTHLLDAQQKANMERMAYGTTCFALLLSFVGTMLGGVWADQSWGRFWGWDPKENGALLIVLWGAIMLHARWAKIVRQRGFMVLAVIGNIVTAWSWFGTNMLGVGLHSYGFMDKAFFALVVFWISQLVIVALAYLPGHRLDAPQVVRPAQNLDQ